MPARACQGTDVRLRRPRLDIGPAPGRTGWRRPGITYDAVRIAGGNDNAKIDHRARRPAPVLRFSTLSTLSGETSGLREIIPAVTSVPAI